MYSKRAMTNDTKIISTEEDISIFDVDLQKNSVNEVEQIQITEKAKAFYSKM